MGAPSPIYPSKPRKKARGIAGVYADQIARKKAGQLAEIQRQQVNAQSAMAAAKRRRSTGYGYTSVYQKHMKVATAAVKGTQAAGTYAAQTTAAYSAGKITTAQYNQGMAQAVSMAKSSSVGGQQTAKKQRQGVSYSQGPVQQSFQFGFTPATKAQGFTAAPTGERPSKRVAAIKTEVQDVAQAKAAFTTTRQKIESGRTAKAQALTEAKASPSELERIQEDAKTVTRMISSREQAEAISRREVSPRQIGPVQTAAILSATTSGEFAKQTYAPKFDAIIGSVGAPLAVTFEQQESNEMAYFGPQPSTELAKATEATLSWLEERQSYQPKNVLEAAGKALVDPFVGLTKAAGTTSAFFYNLGIEASAMILGREPKTPPIKTPPTFLGQTIEGVIEGKSGSEQLSDAFGYIKKYGHESVKGELAEIMLGARGGKAVLKIIPLRYQDLATPGVKYISKGKEVVPKTLAFGYGSKTKPIISKVGSVIQKGKAKVDEIIIEPVTSKQLKRGVKLAADTKKQVQDLLASVESVKKIKGISPISIKRAEGIKEIIDIVGSESKIIPSKASTFGAKPFEKILRAETPSLTQSLGKQQKQIFGKLSPAEGSFGVRPYMLKDFRPSGDFDFSLAKFGTAKKAAIRTAKDIIPVSGRSFKGIISEKSKSAKVYVKEKGTAKKVGEFLNPQEKDEEGILQIIEGSTVFGRKIPTGTDITQGVKHFEPYRQLLKKGESMFSIQMVKGKPELTAASFRESTDVPDFINLAERWVGPLTKAGKIEKAKKLELAITKLKKTYSAYSEITFKPKIEKTVMKYEPSTLSKMLSSPITKESAETIGVLGKPKPVFKPDETKGSPPMKTSTSIRKPIVQKSIGGYLPSKSVYSIKPASQGISPKSAISAVTKISIGVSVSSPISAKSQGYSLISKTSPIIAASSISQSASSLGKYSPTRSPGSLPPRSPISKSSPVSRGGFGTSAPTIRRKAVPIIPIWKTRGDIPRKEPEKYRKPFLGGVHQEEITGWRTIKTDIDYGKKIEKLAREDIVFTRKRKGMKKFVKEKRINLLSKPARIFTPTEKQSKQMLRL